MMKKRFKRNILSVLSLVVFEGLLLKSAFRIDFNDLESIRLIQVVNAIAVVVIAGLILRYLLVPYIVFDETVVEINHNFTKDNFLISEVESVDIENGFFAMKNEKKITFNSFLLEQKSKESLRAHFKELQLIK